MDSDIAWMVRVFLAMYFSSIALFYVWRLTRAKDLVHLGTVGSCHHVNQTLFRVFRATIWLVCVSRVFAPKLDQWLGIIPLLYQNDAILFSGAIMLVAGFGVALTGHYQLGPCWRSGIDPGGPAKLVRDGLYSRSRNPMMIGVLLAQSGFFLALPSSFSLVCLLMGLVAVLSQVRIEESHLAQAFPTEYPSYQRQVRRWL